MQGTKLLAKLSGVTLLCLATSAFAEMSLPYGWYLEGNVGSSRSSNNSYPGSTSSSGIGGNVNFGYKFMPFFAAEMGYTMYANSSIKNSVGTKAATIKNYSYDITGKGILPISNSPFEVFAKLGAARANANISINNAAAASALGISSSSHNTTGFYYGVGADYSFIPEAQVVVQWQRAQGNSTTGTLDLISAGLSYIFG